MQGQGSTTGPLAGALEFEGRFMSSRPVTNNPFCWHHEQNTLEQQLPNFIPVSDDADSSQHSSAGQSVWNAERLNLGLSSSGYMKTECGYSDHMMENGSTSLNAYAEAFSGSNNLPYPSITGTSQGNMSGSSTHESSQNLIKPVIVQNSRSEISLRNYLSPATSSGHARTEHFAMASSSTNPSMENQRTSSPVKKENNDESKPTVVSSSSSDKRKSPEGGLDESSASASKRVVQIAGSSGLQAAPPSLTSSNASIVSLSSANLFGLSSSDTLRSGAIPPASSSINGNSLQLGMARRVQTIQHNIQISENTSLPDTVPTYPVLSPTDIRHDNHPVVQRPRLVLPPPQAVGEGSNSNVQNHPISVHYPVTPQQNVPSTRHHNAPSIAYRYSPGSSLVMHSAQRNSAQSLLLPMTAPSVGSRNLRRNARNIAPSGADAVIPGIAAPGSHSDSIPSLPQTTHVLVVNRNRRRRSEQIRQALLAVDALPQESGVQSVVNRHGTQSLDPRATLLQTSGHYDSSFGPPDDLDSETRQRFLSRARQIISMYREGDNLALESGGNVRQSLISALASIQDQHRDMRLDVDNMSYEELLELGERIGDVKTGLSEETIVKCLKHSKHKSTLKSEKAAAEPCSICQEEYAEGENIGSLDCGHEYHTNCIKQWLLLKNLCPICKAAASSSK